MLFLGILVSLSVGSLEYILETFAQNDAFTEANLVGQGPVLLSLLLIATLLINIPGMGVALADKFIGGGRGLEFKICRQYGQKSRGCHSGRHHCRRNQNNYDDFGKIRRHQRGSGQH